jgi:hypothetical protein
LPVFENLAMSALAPLGRFFWSLFKADQKKFSQFEMLTGQPLLVDWLCSRWVWSWLRLAGVLQSHFSQKICTGFQMTY